MSSKNKVKSKSSYSHFNRIKRNKEASNNRTGTNNINIKRLAEGTLQITRSGMGFAILNNEENDVKIRPTDFNTALNGDKVLVAITRENAETGKSEGFIKKILERKQTEFIGTIQLSKNFAFFIADGDKKIPDIYIPIDKTLHAPDRSKVAVRLLKWENNGKKPLGEVISLLSKEDVNDNSMNGLLMENGFRIGFPKEVMDEANALPETMDKKEIKKRKDLRKVLTFTIDPTDSKDFDDAISFKKLKGGKYQLGVHIADVSHYVREHTPLDKEAYSRATSVYLPDRVNPMLPEEISNVLCSLRPNEDKYTFSVVFDITEDGAVKDIWMGKTVIHSDRRFTYDEVQDILTGTKDPLSKDIQLINTISQNLRKKRFEHGAINFSSQEVRFILDEKGFPIGIKVNESNESHQLIEELMLLANRSVAEYIAKLKVNDAPLPFPYRIHDRPDEEKLLPFVAFAKKFGYKFDISTPDKIAESFNAMLENTKGKPEQLMLQQLGIRTMAKAAYAPQNIGHYGLGFEDYCHFTSPIRRYPDVMVHRILESCLEGTPFVDAEMGAKCKHCSERERASLECERAANKYKQVEYMQQFVGEEVEGLVSGVSNFGFWVETIDAKCEGLVSIKDLADYDDFVLMEGDYSLRGMRTGKKFRMGDRVWVRVAATDLEKRQIDYIWLPKDETLEKIAAEKKSEVPSIPVQTQKQTSDETAKHKKKKFKNKKQQPKAEVKHYFLKGDEDLDTIIENIAVIPVVLPQTTTKQPPIHPASTAAKKVTTAATDTQNQILKTIKSSVMPTTKKATATAAKAATKKAPAKKTTAVKTKKSTTEKPVSKTKAVVKSAPAKKTKKAATTKKVTVAPKTTVKAAAKTTVKKATAQKTTATKPAKKVVKKEPTTKSSTIKKAAAKTKTTTPKKKVELPKIAAKTAKKTIAPKKTTAAKPKPAAVVKKKTVAKATAKKKEPVVKTPAKKVVTKTKAATKTVAPTKKSTVTAKKTTAKKTKK